MEKALLILLVILGLGWYQLAGPGAPGNSPRGTARAFTRALAAEDCASRLPHKFPAVTGAADLCSASTARGLRAQARFYVVHNDGLTALVDCLYGNACGRNRAPCGSLRFELVNHSGRWRIRSVERDVF